MKELTTSDATETTDSLPVFRAISPKSTEDWNRVLERVDSIWCPFLDLVSYSFYVTQVLYSEGYWLR